MKLQTTILLILSVYFLIFSLHAVLVGKTVYGDGKYYYAWLHSIATDHDIHFANEYHALGISWQLSPRDVPANKYSIGPALFWLPAYVHILFALPQTNWLSFSTQYVVGISSVFAAIAGLILLTRILPKTQGAASLTLLGTAGATNLLFYGAVDPVNSHAITFLYVASLLVLLASDTRHSFAIGIVLGLLASVRLQDIVFILLILPHWKRLNIPVLIAGIGIACCAQFAAWYGVYGSLTNPYILGGEGFNLLNANIVGVLFSPKNGLLLWTPIILLGIYGLIVNWKRYWSYLAVFGIELVIVASWSSWSQGASYSGRMFVSSLPLIAVGMGEILRSHTRIRVYRNALLWLIGSLCFLNASLILFFLLTN